MSEEILKLIVEVIIPVLGIIVTTVLVPYIKKKLSVQQIIEIETWADLAVKAAEMIYTEKGKGTEKKAYVVTFLSELFKNNGISITEEQIDVIIESAVKQLKIQES